MVCNGIVTGMIVGGWVFVLSLTFTEQNSWAGGAWISQQRSGNIQFGFSRKTADRVWDAGGRSF